jgi:hypothetical protein
MGLVHHFLHIYFFTEFEIFFYFYYILPYEKQTVYDMFTKNKLVQYDDYEIFIHSNISSIENQCAAEDERINANHDEIWSYCCAYVIFINTTLFLVFARDFIKCYRGFALLPRTDSTRALTSIESNHKKTDSDFEFEMVDLEASQTPTTVVVVPFKLYYWENSEFIAATCKIIQFIVLIGVFEYLFFSFIINKYKVISGKMVLCKLLKY